MKKKRRIFFFFLNAKKLSWHADSQLRNEQERGGEHVKRRRNQPHTFKRENTQKKKKKIWFRVLVVAVDVVGLFYLNFFRFVLFLFNSQSFLFFFLFLFFILGYIDFFLKFFIS